MLELLQSYSVSEIIIFIVLLACAIKGVVSFWDWVVERLRKVFNKEFIQKNNKIEINKKLQDNLDKMNEITEQQNKIINEMSSMKQTINLLIKSDKDDIKSWITEKHHHFCYEVKYIDDYSLDCIEKRYDHYIDEGGNSFIHELMEEIRALPKVSVIQNDKENK